MLIVITQPYLFPDEANAIVRLFEQRGIDLLHLRKPGLSEEQVESLLMALPCRYLSRITIHDHVRLAQKYGLGGIHLTSRVPDVPAGWQGRVSTSCHSLEELAQRKHEGYSVNMGSEEQPKLERRHFDYLSLSPIFDSISKQGYRAAFSYQQLSEAKAEGLIDQRVLALGGVTFDRMEEVSQMGFGGGMILGDAWRGSRVVLTIAGSDSSAGAGIQQDLKTITALGNYAATVITAITAQNTLGVQGVMPVSGEMVARQMRSVLEDLDVRAIKIGMIPTLEVAKAIVEVIKNHLSATGYHIKPDQMDSQVQTGNQSSSEGRHPSPLPIVLDPVMISTSGTRLMAEECIDYVVHELMPLCTLVTPNLPEIQLLDKTLQGHYPTHFLVKGGHAEGEAMTDRLLMLDGTVHTYTEQRITTRNLHGTGCTLSSAIASLLADGHKLPEAVAGAKRFLTKAIMDGVSNQIGHGNGPLKV